MKKPLKKPLTVKGEGGFWSMVFAILVALIIFALIG